METADDRMAQVFRALADPTRRRLLDRLHAENGQTLGSLCRDLDMTRQGITQHLDVLVSAGPVTTVRRGREKLHYLNPVPLHEISQRWIAKFEHADLDALTGLKQALEQETKPMEKPALVYVTYIVTTPDELWSALTDPELTAQYWGHRNVSDWTLGSAWEHRRIDSDIADVVGRVVEIDPPRRLVYTWAAPADADDPTKHSTVTFELEPVAGAVRLTMTHEGLPLEQVEGTNSGWALVLSSLKSFLETGRPLTELIKASTDAHQASQRS